MMVRERKRSTGRSQASQVELAEDWLMAKELASRSTSVNSTLARRRDLCRWGRAIRSGLGRPDDETERLSIETDLTGVRLSDLTTDNCLQALAVLRVGAGIVDGAGVVDLARVLPLADPPRVSEG